MGIGARQLAADEYMAVPFAWMQQGGRRDFPLYLRLPDGQYVLFCETGEAITPQHLARLIEHSVSMLYVKAGDTAALDQYLSAEMSQISGDASVPVRQKADVVYRCSQRAVGRVFDDPRAETIAECRETVGKLAEATLQQPQLGRALLRLTRHDQYTYDHSVNVGIFATILAQEWFGRDRELNKALAGAFFLHDIGKCRIPLDVLNKPGPLDRDERAVMQKHPVLGFQMLSEAGQVTEETAIAVLQHHERADGSGYPHGLPNQGIHEFAKIVTIVDVFDALTTNRPYRRAISTYQALTIIRDEMSADFTPEFFGRFVMLFADERYPSRWTR